jgi:hypothetical protein
VRTNRGETLVFVIDVSRCVEGFLQSPGSDERRGSIQFVQLAYRLWDLDKSDGHIRVDVVPCLREVRFI